jgi:pimeloyl-ACP methyl ester carboxylesterase
MIKVATFLFVAIEAQKCLSRILGNKHPASEANLDDLEERVLAEAGLRLRREDALRSTDTPEETAAASLPYGRVRSLRMKWQKSSLVKRFDERDVVARRVVLERWNESIGLGRDQARRIAGGLAPVQRKLDFSEIRVGNEENVASLNSESPSLRRYPSLSSLSSEVSMTFSESGHQSPFDRQQSLDGYLSPLTDPDGSECFKSPSISTCSQAARDVNSTAPTDAATTPFVHVLVAGDEQAMLTGRNTKLRPLLLLHGHSMSSVYFRHVLAELASTGQHVVYALDMLGWGRSARPPFATKRSSRDPEAEAEQASQFMVEAIAEFLYSSGIESWCRKSGKRIDIIAHSLGAYVASRYAVESSRGLIQNLILVTPAGIWAEQSYQRAVYFRLTPQLVMRNAGFLGYICFRWRWPGGDPGFRSPNLRRYTYALATRRGSRSADIAFAALVTVSHVRRQARCLRPLGQGDAAHPSILERLPCHIAGQVRIIAGANDPLIGVPVLERAFQTLSQAASRKNQVSLCVIPECGHVPFVEQPARFLEACEFAEVSDIRYDTGKMLS